MANERVERWNIDGRDIDVTVRSVAPGAVTSASIAPNAVETGNVLDDLRNGDPKMVEALILTSLARTTLNGFTELGQEQARHFLDLYKQHVVEQAHGTAQ